MDIEINCRITCGESHSISKDVELLLKNKLNAHVTVHIDPIELNNPTIDAVKIELEKMKSEFDFLQTFHDLRFKEDEQLIIFDVVLKSKSQNVEKMNERLKNKFKNINFKIHVDPIFVNN